MQPAIEESENPVPTPDAEPEHEPEDPDYWAALPTDKFGPELADRIREYYQELHESGLIALWRKTHAHFYGLSTTGGGHETSDVTEFGDDGEKLSARSNQLRSLVRYIHTATTTDRPAIQPKAMNTTARALAQVPTAKRIVDYYHKRRRYETALRGTALRALLYAKGYLWQPWDPTAGKPIPGAGPVPQTEGDLVYRPCSPLEVACDLERDSYDHDWLCVRTVRSRFDRAAIFAPEALDGTPNAREDGLTNEELRERILGIEKDCLEAQLAARISFGLYKRRMERTDTIYEYHFMHRQTPALPEGRYVIMVGEGLVLFDGPLPYDDLPISEMVPEEFMEAGSIGYASVWDLLGLQVAYDALLSTCLTNFDAFGHNDILIPDGIELSVEELRDGLNVIRFPPGEFNRPTMLEKFGLKPEVFTLKDWLKQDLELNSGVNATVRGEPQATAKSGSALALLEAQTIHFQSGVVAAYTQLVEDSSTKTIQTLKRYAKKERLASIAGANDPDGLVAFSSQDIDEISHIECEQANPLVNTLAGKVNTADSLLERGLIRSAAEYFEIRETGRLEIATDPRRKEDLRVQRVKEILLTGPATQEKLDEATGQPYLCLPELPVVWTDHPVYHIQGAKEVLDTEDGRSRPEVASACTAYIMEVLRVWRAAPKDGLAILGYPMPPPLPGDPMIAPQDPNAKGGEGPAVSTDGKGQVPPNGQGAQSGQDAPPAGSNMPSLPKPAKKPQVPTTNDGEQGE